MSIDVAGAAARLLANKTLAKAGYCLYYVWLAISQGAVHYITGGADTAYNTWLAVPADHQHASRVVPTDFPAFLGKKFTSAAGDVIISRGDGTFVATDWPNGRQVGICTLAEREKQTGRKFIGWASSMGGHELVSTSTAGNGGTPITDKESSDDMPKNFHNTGGTIFTLGETFCAIWSNPNDFYYLTAMAMYGPATDVNLTPDQLSTVAADANARGARYSATGGTVSTTAVLTDAQLAQVIASIKTADTGTAEQFATLAAQITALGKTLPDDTRKAIAAALA